VEISDTISITDKQWIAVEIGNEKMEQLSAERFPTLKLSESRMMGYSSCNRMTGTYTIEKDKITFGAIAITKMLCMDTRDIEDKYLKAFSDVKLWKYEQDKLYFLNEKKQVIIIFEEKSISDNDR